MSVKPEHRIRAWNIVVITRPPHQRCGFYQANGALTYGTVFEDLFTCFPQLNDLNPQLVLALCQERKIITGEGETTEVVSFIYFSDNQSCQQPVPVLCERQDEYLQPLVPKSVPYHLITHDRGNCTLGSTVLRKHLSVGCARYLPDSAMRPDLHYGGNYHPIDSPPDSPISPAQSDLEGHRLFMSGSPTMSPTTPTSAPINLPSASPLARIPSPGSSNAQEPAVNPTIECVRASTMAPSQLRRRGPELPQTEFRKAIKKPRPPPHEFESAVKSLAGYRCIISGQSNQWDGGMLGGPGLEACHIVPKVLYWDYPPGIPGEATVGELETFLDAQWERTNNGLKNGICLRSDLHKLFDARLLAINPDTHHVRFFGPVGTATPYHHTRISFQTLVPDREALEYHWHQCLRANILAAISFKGVSVSTFPGGGGPPSNSSRREDRGLDDSTEEGELSKKRPRNEEGPSTDPPEERGPSKRAHIMSSVVGAAACARSPQILPPSSASSLARHSARSLSLADVVDKQELESLLDQKLGQLSKDQVEWAEWEEWFRSRIQRA